MATRLAHELLLDGFGRVVENVGHVVGGLAVDDLLWQPQPGANSIGWIVWHIARMEDAQIADIAGTEPVWTRDGWYDRFALPYEPEAHGWGQTADEVAAFRIDDPGLLTGYYDAVHTATVELIEVLDDDGFDRVVDERWDPPVTVAVRLVSIVDDAAQHVGQAAYLKGLREQRDVARAAEHRRHAVDANNSTWELLDPPERSPDEVDELLDRAYAAMYHWRRASGGGPANASRASWLVSRVHAVLGQGDLALHHADQCLAVVTTNGLADFDLAYAHEARARALACLGRLDEAAVELADARAVSIADDEDRKIVDKDVDAEPWYGLR